MQQRFVGNVRLVTCSRCFGRGYQPEYRANGGFYARTCAGCGGSGEREPTRRDLAAERRQNEDLDRRAATIRQWRIGNPASGADLGVYEGATKAEALDAYARDAGYPSFRAACEVTGDDPDDDAGLRVVEVRS